MRINDPAIKSKKFLILLLLFSELLAGIAVTVPHGSPKSMTVIGIDLGTTYSRVAVFRKGDVDIIPNDLGNRVTPSWVAFTDSETLVGEAAKNQATMNAERTIFDVNRLIGRKFDDPEVQRDIKFLPYKVVNKGGKPYIQVKVKGESKVFSPEEISAMILGKMKETAEAYLGKKIEDAVITVPAYFDEAQRRATDDAGEIAGLNVAQIIDEPTAAAIACCHGERSEKNILVYDLGGGTFDASVVKIFNFASQVLATSGDTHLGGEDFDLRLMDYFIKLFKKKYNKDIRKDKKALGKLRRECERAKRALSDQQQVQVKIESLFDGIDFSEPLTRERFEELNMDLFRKTLGPVKKALEDAGLERICVDEIVLVGGSTRIPKVQQLLKDMFDGKEPKMDVNPDEAVAYGAAFKGGIVSSVEWLRAFPLILVNPSSLGVETVGGIMTKLIPRKVMLPIKKSQVFTTYQDRQTTVSIKVFEGGRNLTKDCRELVRFDLSDIPPAPRGVPQIEVTFELKGVLRVTAVDKATKKSQSVTVIPDDGITSEWIEKRFKEAEEMDEEDERVKEMIDARNELEPYIYSIGSSINDKDMLTGKRDSDDEEMTEKTMKEALQ